MVLNTLKLGTGDFYNNMLFTGEACFSPSVPEEIRKLWVMNGGKIAHTFTNFYTAQFFFCKNLRDPWVNQLLSRSLIVRHASWITLCISEGFLMPLGPYTLDDAFDEYNIDSMKPPGHELPRSTEFATSAQNISADLWANGTRSSIPKAYTRKRALEVEGDSSGAHMPARPTKKARVDTCRFGQNAHNANSEAGVPRVSFLDRRQKGSKAARRFERLVQGRQRGPSAASLVGKFQFHYDRINQHTLFWNDILARQARRQDVSAPLVLSIDDVLRAPPTNAIIFDVNDTYLGRRFSNSQETIKQAKRC